MSLSIAERIRLGLEDPPEGYEPGAEFDAPGLSAPRQIPAPEPNLKLLTRPEEKASAPRIRALVNELLAGNVANADFALKQLFSANPKQALELYIELAQFSLPKLKAVAVQVDDRSDNPKGMSFQQLQQVLTQLD